MSSTETRWLAEQEIEQFHQQGYLGPFKAVNVEEMAELDSRIEQEVFATDGPCPNKPEQSRHMDCRTVYDLAKRPEIVERMKCLYGPDLILWATYFFTKDPGGKEIPWHQDLNYWPLEPIINISAWIAIDQADVENSCVQLIPGSHKKTIPHIAAPEEMAFSEMADPAFFDTSNVVDMELQPGEFFLFNEKLLHHSNRNVSNRRRRGMTMRVTIPIVKIDHDPAPLHPGHCATVLAGRDYMGFNRLCDGPTDASNHCA